MSQLVTRSSCMKPRQTWGALSDEANQRAPSDAREDQPGPYSERAALPDVGDGVLDTLLSEEPSLPTAPWRRLLRRLLQLVFALISHDDHADLRLEE